MKKMNKEITKMKKIKITEKMKNKKMKNPPPALFAQFRLSYRYGLPFDNILLFFYCCSFAYF